MNVVKRSSFRHLDFHETQTSNAAVGGQCRFFEFRRGQVEDASEFDPIFWH